MVDIESTSRELLAWSFRLRSEADQVLDDLGARRPHQRRPAKAPAPGIEDTPLAAPAREGD